MHNSSLEMNRLEFMDELVLTGNRTGFGVDLEVWRRYLVSGQTEEPSIVRRVKVLLVFYRLSRDVLYSLAQKFFLLSESPPTAV